MRIHDSLWKSITSFYLSAILLMAGITSIVVSPSFSASVPSYLLIYAFTPILLVLSIRWNKNIIFNLSEILLLLVVLNLLALLNDQLLHVHLTSSLPLVKNESLEKVIFRKTLFTQSLYLFAGILLYLFLRYYGTEKHIHYLYTGLLFLVLYGFFEVIYYQINKRNGDLLSNREFNKVAGSGSLFQEINIAGWVMQRLKSLTGEPSMFAFSIVPFWILSIGLKYWLYSGLFLIALILSFSTSAFIGIFIAVLGVIFIHPALRKKATWILPFLLFTGLLLYFFNTPLRDGINNLFIYKLTGGNVSGVERREYFLNAINFWKNDLTISGKLIGIGFGTIRSTDFFSTLLVNNGIIGFIVFTVFYFSHAYIPMNNKSLKQYYVVALLATYVIMMVSVPEFAYLTLWVLLAFPYFIERKRINYTRGV